MTQKTLPILGTVCMFSLVFLGILAGCKEKKNEEPKETASSENSDHKEPNADNKKDISFEEIKDDAAEAKDKEGKNTDSSKTHESEKTDDKAVDDENKEEEKDKKKEEHKKDEKKDKLKDEDRVALVEKTLELMANSRGHSGSTGKDVEDVLLA